MGVSNIVFVDFREVVVMGSFILVINQAKIAIGISILNYSSDVFFEGRKDPQIPVGA